MIRIGRSSVHGDGAFAARDFAQGERIGVYEGRRYSPRAVKRRDWDHDLTYVFGLTDGSVIDASSGAAQQARQAAAWVTDRAQHAVPPEFRDSFLHRNPVHAALLSWPAR
jgi:hypothetical protein